MKKFWKRLNLTQFGLVSPFYRHKWKPGWNKCDRVEVFRGEVNNSIHVYTFKKENDDLYVRIIMVPVYANACDLIAYGYGREAAFKKVFLKKEDYEEAKIKAKKVLGTNFNWDEE